MSAERVRQRWHESPKGYPRGLRTLPLPCRRILVVNTNKHNLAEQKIWRFAMMVRNCAANSCPAAGPNRKPAPLRLTRTSSAGGAAVPRNSMETIRLEAVPGPPPQIARFSAALDAFDCGTCPRRIVPSIAAFYECVTLGRRLELRIVQELCIKGLGPNWLNLPM